MARSVRPLSKQMARVLTAKRATEAVIKKLEKEQESDYQVPEGINLNLGAWREMTYVDQKIIEASLGNANIFLKYYFDIELLPHQLAVVHAKQNSVLTLGGRGSGKTFGYFWGYIWMLTTIPDFRVLWGSFSSDQAAIPFHELLVPVLANSDKFMKFLPEGLKSIKRNPYPSLEVRIPGLNIPSSHITFKTVGDQANTKRGFTLDAIHFDEAGLEPDVRVLTTLRPSMRGRRATGDPRLGRLSISTTPTGVEWLRDWWRRANDPTYPKYDPDNYFAVRVTSRENTHLTPEQVRSFYQDMTEAERRVEIEAEFPDYLGTDFPPSVVIQCEDDQLLLEVSDYVRRRIPGYQVRTSSDAGIYYYETPPKEGHQYLLAGDPGTGNPPHRNSGCLMVFDISRRPYELVHFHWVYGNGKYRPFLDAFTYALDLYKPMFALFDSTGPQAAMDELYFEHYANLVEGVAFNATNKMGMLNAAKLILERGWIRMPRIDGLRGQLMNYDRENDRKLAQDLVMAFAMAAWKMRMLAYMEDRENQIQEDPMQDDLIEGRSEIRDAVRFTPRGQ